MPDLTSGSSRRLGELVCLNEIGYSWASGVRRRALVSGELVPCEISCHGTIAGILDSGAWDTVRELAAELDQDMQSVSSILIRFQGFGSLSLFEQQTLPRILSSFFDFEMEPSPEASLWDHAKILSVSIRQPLLWERNLVKKVPRALSIADGNARPGDTVVMKRGDRDGSCRLSVLRLDQDDQLWTYVGCYCIANLDHSYVRRHR